MNRKEIEIYLTTAGWKRDNFGHFKIELKGNKTGIVKTFRCKMQSTSMRLERRDTINHEYSPEQTYWFKLSSDYYKNIVLDDSGKLLIGKIRI